jgi:hypothetical protein
MMPFFGELMRWTDLRLQKGSRMQQGEEHEQVLETEQE